MEEKALKGSLHLIDVWVDEDLYQRLIKIKGKWTWRELFELWTDIMDGDAPYETKE